MICINWLPHFKSKQNREQLLLVLDHTTCDWMMFMDQSMSSKVAKNLEMRNLEKIGGTISISAEIFSWNKIYVNVGRKRKGEEDALYKQEKTDFYSHEIPIFSYIVHRIQESISILYSLFSALSRSCSTKFNCFCFN